MQAIVAPSQRLDDCLWKINVWNLTRIERWRESIESFCLYGFELGDINGTLIRCDLQSRENWGQVTIVVPSLVTIEECVSPGFSKSVCPLVFLVLSKSVCPLVFWSPLVRRRATRIEPWEDH